MRATRLLAAGAGVVLLGLGLPATEGSAAVAQRAPMQPASPIHFGQPQQGPSTNGTQSSFNWAGYAVTGGAISDVAGDWQQPAAFCSRGATQAAFWVGIDGFSSSDPTVEQIGTDSDCTKGRGKKGGGPSYYAWYQLYPQALVVLSPAAYPVAAGDQIHAAVFASGSAHTLAITDGSKWSFVTNPSVAAQNSSAEWIAEAPSSCTARRCKSTSLTDFSSMAFTSASVNGKAISAPGFTNYEITMVSKGSRKTVRAQPSALAFGGTVFSVTWLHS